MNRIKLKQIHFVLLFIILYPICPHYFRILGVTVRDMVTVGCFMGMVIFQPNINVRINRTNRMFIFVMLIWTALTAVAQLYHREYFQLIKQFLLWCGIVFLIAEAINTKECFLRTIDCLIYIAIVVGLFGVLEEITYYNVFDVINTIGVELNYNTERLGLLRIISFTSHSIAYCCYCMFMLGLIVYRYSIDRKKRFIFAYVIVLLNAFLTVSRSSLVGVVISQILILWFCGFKKFIKLTLQIGISVAIILILGSVLSPKVFNKIQLLYYTVAAVFDNSYVSSLQQAGFTDNASGIGNRIDLYKWVYDSIRENSLFGKGLSSSFEYRYLNESGYYLTKKSIEVEWLRTLYRYGFIGMVAEIWFYLVFSVTSMTRIFKKPQEWEGKISFARVTGALIISYILVLFAVMQNEEIQLLTVIIILFLSYISHRGYETDSQKEQN